jgi:uncharacterized membrane protein
VTRVFRRASVGLGAVGFAASAYLTYVHYAGARVACPTSGCERVQQSFYATPHGVPLALVGAILFLLIVALGSLERRSARVLEPALALAGAIVAVYLIGVQVVSLGATCLWCLTSDLALLGLGGLAVARLLTD